MSETTEKYKKRYKFMRFMSIMSVVGPLIMYTGIGFVNGTITQRLTLGMTLAICLIFTILNVVLKFHIRSTIWIILLGIHACVNNITALLVMIALATMSDEFIFAPYAKRYKNKYIINDEIDKRSE